MEAYLRKEQIIVGLGRAYNMKRVPAEKMYLLWKRFAATHRSKQLLYGHFDDPYVVEWVERIKYGYRPIAGGPDVKEMSLEAFKQWLKHA